MIMRNFIPYLIIFVGLSISSGCAIFNPYEEEFGCPGGDYGKCEKVKDAYDDPFVEEQEKFSPMVKTSKPHVNIESDGPVYDYQKQLYAEMQGIIGKAETPMLTPPKQMRLLVLDYVDNDKVLYGYRYIYFVAEQERWILPLNRIQIPKNHAEILFR